MILVINLLVFLVLFLMAYFLKWGIDLVLIMNVAFGVALFNVISWLVNELFTRSNKKV